MNRSIFRKLVLRQFVFCFTLLLVVLSGLRLSADVKFIDMRANMPKNKKYKLSICAIVKNEEKFLREWIEYHRLVGVDHFYIYDIGNAEKTMAVLRPYVRQNIVSLIPWPYGSREYDKEKPFMWALSTQVPAYENAAKYRAIRETKWLVNLDVEEFLVPPSVNNLGEILDRYESYPGVVLPSNYFDASRIDCVPKRNLVIQSIELISAPKVDVQRSVKKVIFKPDHCEGFLWPPYECVFTDGVKPVELSKAEMRINHYVNRFSGFLNFARNKDRLILDHCSLNEDEKVALLDVGYEIEDSEGVIQRFAPALLRKLGFEPGWGW